MIRTLAGHLSSDVVPFIGIYEAPVYFLGNGPKLANMFYAPASARVCKACAPFHIYTFYIPLLVNLYTASNLSNLFSIKSPTRLP